MTLNYVVFISETTEEFENVTSAANTMSANTINRTDYFLFIEFFGRLYFFMSIFAVVNIFFFFFIDIAVYV